MNKDLLIAIGYPLGAIEIDDVIVHEIQLNDNVFKTDVLNYYTWRMFSSIIDFDKAYELINKNQSVKKNDFSERVDNLINQGLIVSFNMEDTLSIYDKLKKFVVLRQGVGIGLRRERSNYIVRTEEEIEVNLHDYLIWVNADGKRSIKVLIDDYIANIDKNFNIVIESFLESILFLYSRGLIYFTEVVS